MLSKTLASAFILSGAIALAACNNGSNGGDDGSMTDAGLVDGGQHDMGTGSDLGVDHGSIGDAGDTGVPSDGGACGGGYGPCNPVTNAGCSAGMACIVGANTDGGLVSMCAAVGTGGYNATCTSDTDCLEGFTCIGTPTSTCVKLCCGPSDNASCRTGTGGMAGALCQGMVTGSNLYLCQPLASCDWFAQNCPPVGGVAQNCDVVDMSGTTTCTPAGTGTDGVQCAGTGTTVPCAVGFTCIGMAGSSNGFCRAYCDPTLATGADAGATPDGGVSRRCATGRTCTGNFMPPRPANYGVCVP